MFNFFIAFAAGAFCALIGHYNKKLGSDDLAVYSNYAALMFAITAALLLVNVILSE